MLNPYSSLIIAALIWGSSSIFIKYLNLPPTTMAFFRLFIPAIILFFYFRFRKIKLFRSDLKLILILAVISVIENFFYFVAYKNTSIANALVALYTWPAFATLFSAIFLREKIKARNAVLLLLAFLGVLIVYFNHSFSFTDGDFVGMTSMIFSAALFAVAFIIFKKLSANHGNLEIIFYHNFLGAAVFLPFIFINPAPTNLQFAVGIVYGMIIGIVAYIFYFHGLKYVKASIASLFSYLEVPTGILLGIILLGETLAWNVILGGFLIISSTLLIKRE